MDESILVEVYLPAAQLYVDVRLPLFMPIKDIIELLTPMLQAYSKGAFVASKTTYMYHKEGNCVLPEQRCLNEVGLGYGETIILL